MIVAPSTVLVGFNPRLPCGRRRFVARMPGRCTGFNPRLPCGRRLAGNGLQIIHHCFNPRLPCGRRLDRDRRLAGGHCFNPRLPCGRRPRAVRDATMSHRFNPRLPCGRRLYRLRIAGHRRAFQSTPPVWEATRHSPDQQGQDGVSIHASRVGGDQRGRHQPLYHPCFNPRLPCGRRRSPIRSTVAWWTFQSTPPVWEATTMLRMKSRTADVSIHASRVGGDPPV